MGRRYFHWHQAVLGLALTIGAGFGLAGHSSSHGFDRAIEISALLLGLSMGLGFMWLAYHHRYAPNIDDAMRQTKPSFVIEADGLRRIRRYPFGAASVGRNPWIPAASINEVNDGYPLQVVINSREVVFLDDSQREELHSFAKRHNIPISRRAAIWPLIASVYVDTETSPEEHERLFEQLEKQGVSRQEVEAARKKIRLNLLAASYVTMEWTYYDHSDVLRLSSPLWGRQKFYWYTMELALRNFPSSPFRG